MRKFFQILNSIYDKYNCKYLVLAGGCAMNSLANGKILDNSKFEDFYIQPTAHDAGGALGAAMHHTYNLKIISLKDIDITLYILVLSILINKLIKKF